MFYNNNYWFWYKNTNRLTFSDVKQLLLGVTTFPAIQKQHSELDVRQVNLKILLVIKKTIFIKTSRLNILKHG